MENSNIQVKQEDKGKIEKTEEKHRPKLYLKPNKKKEKVNIPDKNIINIEDIESGKETRTIVRISPIPPHYSSFDISKLLDKYLNIEYKKNQRTYKAIYAPLSKVIGKNIGYCFVMLVKPKYVVPFYKTFNGLNFNKKKCKKKCQVTWADVQGEEFLKISDDPLRSPIIFTDLIIDEEEKEGENEHEKEEENEHEKEGENEHENEGENEHEKEEENKHENEGENEQEKGEEKEIEGEVEEEGEGEGE